LIFDQPGWCFAGYHRDPGVNTGSAYWSTRNYSAGSQFWSYQKTAGRGRVWVPGALVVDSRPWIYFKFWLAVIVVSLITLPVIALELRRRFRLFRANRRLRAGLCRACGYDVRFTPGRCPECGMDQRVLPHGNPC
jgi:hypothetical protein